jgi:cyclophilin family peptidyl-prolyl cis-trans isomerase
MKPSLLIAVALALLNSAACEAADTRGQNPVVVMETSKGTVKIELYPDKAPTTVKNFLQYVDDKFYDNTVFHRVIDGFMIQGGGKEAGGNEKETRAPIKNESASNGLSNVRGTIAMARTNDPDSATAQFHINVVDNSRNLDARPGRAGYTVFGKVIDGMDVVDRISKVKTNTRDVPTEDVIIKSIRRADK